jgi:hypothetical protein
MTRNIDIPIGFDDERVAAEVWIAYVAHGDIPLQEKVLRSAFPHLAAQVRTAALLQHFISDVARDLADGSILAVDAIKAVQDYASKL